MNHTEAPSTLFRLAWGPGAPSTHWLTRTLLLRGLGFVYAVAFSVAARQLVPLVGTRGLLPADRYLDALAASEGGRFAGFLAQPSIFWLSTADRWLEGVSWLGFALAVAVALGLSHAAALALLWALYLSICHVGQLWYGYGWEILLLEAGFLAIFLGPMTSGRALARASPPPAPVVWLFRWLAFRVYFGAGLIKIRGDACWRDLSCLRFHYETQPVPSPLSWLLHQAPPAFHGAGVAFNHLVELVVPFAVFLPRPFRTVAGVLMVAFQLVLIASGNLSFLNWLTLVVALACFDDQPLLRVLPRRLRAPLERLLAERRDARPQLSRRWVSGVLVALVLALSLQPVANMLSPRQIMNTSFSRLHLVNTYGAFGSVGKTRDEIIIEGTSDPDPEHARWLAYEFPCKPGDVARRPCLITPYHYRLDWQAWFAAMSSIEREPWLVELVAKLLEGDRDVCALFAYDPFPQEPPRWIRIERYAYRFTRFGERGWWQRRRIGSYLRPVSREMLRID